MTVVLETIRTLDILGVSLGLVEGSPPRESRDRDPRRFHERCPEYEKLYPSLPTMAMILGSSTFGSAHCHLCAYVSAQVHTDITLADGILTPREMTVAGLLAVGPSNQELAQALDVTERTARKYVSSVSRKLNMSRQQVGLLAFATHVEQCPNRKVSDSAT